MRRNVLTAMAFIAFFAQLAFFPTHWPSFCLGILLGGAFLMLKIDTTIKRARQEITYAREAAESNGGVHVGHSTHEQ